MKIKFFCPQWGSTHLDFVDFVKQVKASGYDGIEMSLPLETGEKEFINKTINEHNLLHIAQHWETEATDFSEHKKEYRERITNLASSNPILINSQTGKDFFTFEQNAELIAIANEISGQQLSIVLALAKYVLCVERNRCYLILLCNQFLRDLQ